MRAIDIDTAKAANALLEFSGDNQQALLEVMTDYFTSPDKRSGSDNDEDYVILTMGKPICKVGQEYTKHDIIVMTMHNIKSQTSKQCW